MGARSFRSELAARDEQAKRRDAKRQAKRERACRDRVVRAQPAQPIAVNGHSLVDKLITLEARIQNRLAATAMIETGDAAYEAARGQQQLERLPERSPSWQDASTGRRALSRSPNWAI